MSSGDFVMELIHCFTWSSEEIDLYWAPCSSTISIQDLMGMAEESNFSLEGVDWGSLEGSWEPVSLRTALPLFFFGGIICFEEIPELENQEQNFCHL